MPRVHSETVVNIVRGLRESGKCEFSPTVRGCIMIAKTLKVLEIVPSKSPKFIQLCQDILASETSRVGSKTNQIRVKDIVRELVEGVINKEQEMKKELKTECKRTGKYSRKKGKKAGTSNIGLPTSNEGQ